MLFGHQDDTTNQPAQDTAASGLNPLAIDPDTGASLPVAPEDLEHDSDQDTSVLNQPQEETPTAPDTPADTTGTGAAAYPASNPTAAYALGDESSTSTAPAPPSDGAAAQSPLATDSTTPSAATDDLLGLKQQALEQLSPLVGHLDQTPEEKFHTTMMMIQSSDNQALIKDAYAAAQEISDDKIRAQALLDIVNEINYFTQK